MDPKEQLYYLLKSFLQGKYDTNTFCDQFTVIYDIEVDYSTLSELKRQNFSELCIIAARFSQYEEDLKLKNVYYNEHQVREKAEEVRNKLINE